MRRAGLSALALGILAAAGWMLLAGFGSGAMPSYLAAWLFWLGAPMGALPLVMAMEGLGGTDEPLLPVLRRMLLLLPVGALFAVPVLLGSASLFNRAGVQDPLPGWWTAPVFLSARAVMILMALSLFALAFSRAPSRPRRGLVAFGLVLHLCLASVAAVDWVLALQPGLGSSAIGLLLIVAQMGLAAALAGFVLAVRTASGARLPRGAGLLLAMLLAVWAFLHFLQFLVVWSANLPAEAAWYLARAPGLGGGVAWFAAAAILLGCAVLPSSLGRVPVVLASLAATALLAHLAESLWLVTPAFRGAFSVTLADGLAVLGIGGLLVGLLVLLLPGEPRHGPA